MSEVAPRLARWLAAFLFLAGTVPALAAARPASILDDAGFRAEVTAGLDRLYAMDFAGADAAFARIAARHPDHPVGPFLTALVPWWKLLLDPENTAFDARFLAAMDEVLARSERRLRRDPGDPDGLFFKTGALAFRARVHTYRRHWYHAAQDGRRSLKNLRRLAARDPGNDDLCFGLGLFDYLADAVPGRFRFLKPFTAFFPKGDRRRGLVELERAAERGRFVRAEAAYALYQLYDVFERDFAKAEREIVWLRRRYPTNSLFQVTEGRLYARQGRWAEANLILQEVAERQVAGEPGYTGAIAEQALYWLARGEMAARRYDGALQYLDRLEYLAAERDYDPYYRAAGRLRRGMAYDALGRRDEAVRCYRDVLAINGAGDARDRARDFLAKPFPG